MGHLSHIVIFNLIVTGLSSTYNDIGQITLRWLIKRWFQRNVRIQNLKWTRVVHLHLQWYWTDDICDKIRIQIERGQNMGSIALSNFQHPYYLINLQWDDCYSDDFKEMFEFEVFCWTRTKYGSSIALSNFQVFWVEREMNNIEHPYQINLQILNVFDKRG